MAKKGRKPRRAPKAPRYVGSLDGLRALCALGVIGYHMRLPWMGGGLLGVTILFVLSGYLVTAGLMREFGKSKGTINLGSFWTRRFWRLMPTVVVFIAVTGAVCAVFSAELFTKMRPDILPGFFMIINWTKILSNESYFAAAGAPSPLTHFWSLAIEAQFYLIWPPVFYFLMRKRVAKRRVRIGVLVLALISAILMAVLYVPGADPTRSYYGTDTRAMSLLLGCWLAIIWPFDRMSARRAARLEGIPKIVVTIIGPLCVAGLIAMMIFTEGYTAFSYYGGILLCSIIAVGAIAALVPQGSALSRVLSFSPLAWIGKRSYAIYLWHYPILELMNPLKSTTGIPWWKLLLEFAIILVVSELSYRFVEVPFRAIGKPAPQASKQRSKKSKRARQQSRTAQLLPYIPALAVTAITGIALIVGLFVVKPVTVAGDSPNEKRVMHASLRKPLQDGVYDVVLIGDSVSLGANEQLNAAFPHGMIDTRGERQADEAIAVLEDYLDQGVVGDNVVISIGTNGILDTDIMDTFIEDVGPDRELWFVNMRSPNAKDVDNNALIDEYVEAYDNVHLIDWNSATIGHDEWLIEDGIHLTWEGREEYTNLVVDTMDYILPDDSNTTYDVVILGDTVCLDAADQLSTAYPMGLVDTAEGRTPAAVVTAYKGYSDQDVVGSRVIVCIGNDDELQQEDIDALIDAVGSDKELWFVTDRTPEAWQNANNELLAKAAEENKNVHVIDWFAASEGKEGLVGEDGMHLTKDGIKSYVDLITSEVKPSKQADTSTKSSSDSSSSSSTSSKKSSESKETSGSSSSNKTSAGSSNSSNDNDEDSEQ